MRLLTQRKRTPSTRFLNARDLLWTALLGALVCGGCNNWVEYPDDYQAPPPATIDLELPSLDKLQHYALSGVVNAYSTEVQGRVAVDYDALNADKEALFLLNQYLAIVATLNPSDLIDAEQRLAFWVNAYNALVLRGVLDQYNGDHGFSTFAGKGGFFNQSKTVAGQTLTLNQIEHGPLRGDWQRSDLEGLTADTIENLKTWHAELWQKQVPDARLHAVLNCGVVGCPNLRVLLPTNLEQQLSDHTRQWLDDPTRGAGPNGISTLFDWFGADFTGRHDSIDAFIAAFRSEGLTNVDLSQFLPYDERLNSTENL